jgi:DNA invertase Pin-like site-specific DNA recombinase
MSAKKDARNRRIQKARADGLTLQTIAFRFGVSRQRVHVVLKEASQRQPEPEAERWS